MVITGILFDADGSTLNIESHIRVLLADLAHRLTICNNWQDIYIKIYIERHDRKKQLRMVVMKKKEIVHNFTEKEEEFAKLLIEIGMKKNTEKVLVFLANMTEATSRAVEHRLDLRHPEVSIAIRYLIEQSWIARRVIPLKARNNQKI